MTTINTDRIIGFFAPSRYGKTNAIASLIKSIPLPVVIYDTNKEWSTIPQLIDIVKSTKSKRVFVPDAGSERDVEYLNEIISILRSKLTNFFLYVDDIEVFFNDQTSYKHFFGEIKDLSERGGHQRIGFIYSAKEFKYIPRPLISNANLMYVGQFIEDADLKMANRILKPHYRSENLKKPTFIKIDRWTGEKAEVVFDKVF